MQGYLAILICLVLVVVTLAIYLQVGDHPFLDLDDNLYVTENSHVSGGLTGQNLLWALTSVEAGNWHPVTWLSHMADVRFYGMNPGGHHLTNVIVHICASVLLLLCLLRSTGSLWQSSMVAALFALHPLHVESVAWVAERKDVLSASFMFLTLLFYAEFSKRQTATLYLLSFFSFVLGLMSKPMLVTLPLVMLLMDFWPLDLYRHLDPAKGLRQYVVEMLAQLRGKIPFFVCSLLSALITIYAQQKGGATSSLGVVPLLIRCENALVAYATYVIKTIVPINLAVMYPFAASIPLWQVVGALLMLLLVTAATLWVGRRFPFLIVGWLWFLVTLVPVIGLVQVGSQSMADRYAYIPSIGLFIMLAWGIPALTKGMQHRRAMLGLLAGIVLAASAALTWHQLGFWRDSISLYQHSLQVTSGSYLVHNNLGIALAEKGNLDAAIHEYKEAIRLTPNKFDAHGNLGLALLQKGDVDAAVPECRLALKLSPGNMNSHYNLGIALAEKGDFDAAIREYHAALTIRPNNPLLHRSLGVALINKGDQDAAIQEFQNILNKNPYDVDGRCNLGVALARKEDLDAAIREFRYVLRISPNDSFALNNLDRVLAQKKMNKKRND